MPLIPLYHTIYCVLLQQKNYIWYFPHYSPLLAALLFPFRFSFVYFVVSSRVPFRFSALFSDFIRVCRFLLFLGGLSFRRPPNQKKTAPFHLDRAGKT